jgi:hypothetical protein
MDESEADVVLDESVMFIIESMVGARWGTAIQNWGDEKRSTIKRGPSVARASGPD